MPSTMRVIDITNGKGPISALHHTTRARPTPAAHQALVRIKAFGLNRMDLLQREGNYPVPPQAGPILGVEFSGVVEELGSDGGGDEGFEVGDEVFGLAYGGAYAEFVAVSVSMLVRKPGELGWAEAAGIPETWITATQALYLVANFHPGKSVLFHAAASAVSTAGIQLALADSASAVYATARQDAKCSFAVSSLGATAAFNTSTTNWADEVLKATDGRGVDVIVDFVGGNYFRENLRAVARDGVIVCLGFMGGSVVKGDVDISPILLKRVTVVGSTLRSRDEEYQRKLRDQLVAHALPRFKDGRFKVWVDRVLPWEEIQEGHRMLEANETKGKVMCTIDA